MKLFFRRIHLYLSLAAGLVILTACLTGAILVFEKDLQMSFYKERYFVNEGNNKLPTVQLTQFVKDSFPPAKINGIKVYEDALRSAEINVSFASKKETKPADRQAGYTIFIDPYNGKILEKYNYKETFFYNVFALHRWLLGGNKGAGKYIVGVSTLIFLFVITTGIILWWPKTKKILQQRIKIKSNAGWKRLNHDLHIVFGFYSALFLFIIAFTGLAWSFEWFNKGIYTMTNSPLKNPPPPQSIYISNTKTISFDEALATAKTVYPNADFYSLSMPKDSVEAVTVAVLNKNALHESATDAVYVDQYSGVVLGQLAFEERSLGAKVRSTFKPVHTGSIWDMPSKIIAFIVCLFGVSFPITGTIMWMNRTRKKKIASIKTKDKAITV
ncbi:MAG: PepSY-associated TM helix domain-containing protein [Flavisolibacter sp.]